MKFLLLLKKIFEKHPAFAVIAFISVLCQSIQSAFSIIKIWLPSGFVILIFVAGLTEFIKALCVEIENSRKDFLGHKSPEFGLKTIRIAQVFKRFRYVLFLWPFLVISMWVYDFVAKKNLCKRNAGRIGLFIANFSPKKDEDDGFTSTLYGKLNSDLQIVDSIYLKQLGTYISESKDDYLESLKTTFRNNCINSGLFVFGNRSDEKIFNCRIFSFNYLPKIEKSFITRDNTIIYIQNPQILKFDIENEATVVAKFLYGLLYYKKGESDNSSKYFIEALSLNENKENKQFITLCKLFLGDNALRKRDYNGAIEEFQAGINVDSTNAYLRYNLASAYRILGDFHRAYNEYQTAQKIDSRFTNPLTIIGNKIIRNHDSDGLVDLKPIGKKTQTATFKIATPNFLTESFRVLEIGSKCGVVSSSNDTIVPISYDGIMSYQYHGSNCFVLRSGKRYGVAIEKKFDDGYSVHRLPMDYSAFTIMKAAEFCVDNHMSKKDTSLEFFRFKIRRQ